MCCIVQSILTRKMREEVNAIIEELPTMIWQRFGGVHITIIKTAREDVENAVDGL